MFPPRTGGRDMLIFVFGLIAATNGPAIAMGVARMALASFRVFVVASIRFAPQAARLFILAVWRAGGDLARALAWGSRGNLGRAS